MAHKNPDDYCLYILMRTDMESMNPGKAMAQASHATSMFEDLCANDKDVARLANLWRGELQFGTTIVLGVSESQIKDAMAAMDEAGPWHAAAECVDPTYPLKDGYVTHLIPVLTCAYVFCKVSVADQFLCHLSRHP